MLELANLEIELEENSREHLYAGVLSAFLRTDLKNLDNYIHKIKADKDLTDREVLLSLANFRLKAAKREVKIEDLSP